VTQVGLIKGKVEYMPPEQVTASPLDARTDVYAMGIVLYELLTGKRPFAKRTDNELMKAIIQEPGTPLRFFRPEIDPTLEQVVSDALEKHPDDRFQSAGEMAAALDRYLQTTRGEMVQPAIHSLLVDLFGQESAQPAPSTGQGEELGLSVEPTIPALSSPPDTREAAPSAPARDTPSAASPSPTRRPPRPRPPRRRPRPRRHPRRRYHRAGLRSGSCRPPAAARC